MGYVDFEFYCRNFGGQIQKQDFETVEAKAEAFIRYLTYVNGDIFAVENDSIKMAVCAAAEIIRKSEEKAEEGATSDIKSESNDGYSVTYVTESQDGKTAEENLRKKIYEAVRIYLLPIGWLFRGVRMGTKR